MSTGTVAVDVHNHQDDIEYPLFLESIQLPNEPLFTTGIEDLFDIFLAYLPTDRRQHYTCSACRHFVNRFGGLVTISENGVVRSALWSGDVPEFFELAVKAMKLTVERGTVTGVFLTSKETLGVPVTGEWHQMSASVPTSSFLLSRRFSAGQAMAEKVEDFGVLSRGLDEYGIDVARVAKRVADSDALYRSEKIRPIADWFLALHESIQSNKRNRTNLIWRAVATAPAGFAHIRNTMIGTLMTDILAGMDFDTVSRRFAEKMHPLQYQRPQAAPSAGNIAQAEKIVEQLGIANSLKRRFARLEEIQALWKPRVATIPTATGMGVFGHLQPKVTKTKSGAAAIDLPSQTMTWVKFRDVVLPEAEGIEFFVPQHGNFCGMLTAADMDAPPIIQWDLDARRNPVSWYLYNNGSSPLRWGLSSNEWVNVTAVCLKPSMWQEGFDHHGKGVIFVLEKAKDSDFRGLGLFPEILKGELREVRATIEAYSNSLNAEGGEEGTANGFMFFEGGSQGWGHSVRVTANGAKSVYKLDRWD